MNQKNCKAIRERIQEASQNLMGKLPQSSRHPEGRNPYAHIPKVIMSVMGTSYKNLPDTELENVMKIIDYCEENPF